MKVDAVVLAGAPNNGQLKEASSEKWEAMIPIHGKPMVNYVIEALQDSSRIANIVVVGPLEIKEVLVPNVHLVEAGESLTDNVYRSIEVLEKKNKVLFVTSDIPFVSAEAIDDFVDRCAELSGDIFYPIISREANQQVYPEAVRTYFPLKEGAFTGGNIILASPQAVANSRWAMEQVFFRRKKPWKVIRMLGFVFICKFFAKQLTLRQLEQRASDILGYKGVVIISPYPELGTDVDKPSDLELALKTIAVTQGKEA